MVLADLRALASRLAHVPASLPVLAFHRVPVEPPVVRRKAEPRRPAFVPHVPASAVAVSATKR